jgi:nucleoside-diphosphate-sugar epimerase
MDGIQTVYHLGAAMGGGGSDYECANIWGTRNVIESCLRHGVKRLIYVSSLSVLDHAGHRPDVPIHESSPLEPHPERRGLYTQTKLKAEQMIRQAIQEHGLPAVILRPGQIFGPGATNITPAGTIRLGGRWIVLGNGDWPLPLVYVDDVVDALLLAAQNQHIVGSVFHLVDDEIVTQKQYIEAAQRKNEGSIRVLCFPASMALGLAAGIGVLGSVSKHKLAVSAYRVRSLRPLWPCECSAARNLLQWKPRVGAREGLRLTFGLP